VGVAEWSGSLLRWERELSELKDRLAPVFGRSEIRQSAGAFIDGVLSSIARKTGWQLAEQAGLDRRAVSDAVAAWAKLLGCGCAA
jgi:hypothetical protein